jgi:benzodiazapine receptor
MRYTRLMKDTSNRTYEWYQMLRKPTWAPPAWIFGPVWSALYTIIAFTYAYVGYSVYIGALPKAILAPFVLNLIFNALYTPLQFLARNLILATVDILLTLATLAAALYAIFPYAAWIAYANIPYFLWVIFATILQCTITIQNRDKWK